MIEEISIQNFKSIGNVHVKLSPVTVLIGRSGAGKSNFLRAIRFLRNYLLHGQNAVKYEGGWQRIFPFGHTVGLYFNIRFRIPGYDKIYEYELSWGVRPNQPEAEVNQFIGLAAERLRLGGQMIFGRSEEKWELWPDSRPPPRIEPKVYLDSFPTVSEAVLAFTFLTNGIGWHDFPANVFRLEPQQQAPPSKELNDSAQNYLSVLRDLTQNLQSQYARRQILARVRQINPSVSSIELDSILNPKKVVVGHKVAGQSIPLDLSQESDGFRRYYAHLLALYQTPPRQVLMFEEPENGIYPGALHNLAEEFRVAAADGRGQVLLTTQSPDLLDGFEPESIRVVDADARQTTIIAPLDPTQTQAVRDQLLEPGELLTVDTARPEVKQA